MALKRLDVVPGLEPKFADPITFSAKLNDRLLLGYRLEGYTVADHGTGDMVHFENAAKWRHYKQGSWRRMFVAQPPPVEIVGVLSLDHGRLHRFEISQTEGVTTGGIVDMGLELEAEGRNVHWNDGWLSTSCRVFTTEAEERLDTIFGS